MDILNIDIKEYVKKQKELRKLNCIRRDELKEDIEVSDFLSFCLELFPIIGGLISLIVGIVVTNPITAIAICFPVCFTIYFGSKALAGKVKKGIFKKRVLLRQVESEIQHCDELEESVNKLEDLIKDGLTQEKYEILSTTYKEVNDKEYREVPMEEFISYIYPEKLGTSCIQTVGGNGLFQEEKIEIPTRYLRMEKLYEQSNKKL